MNVMNIYLGILSLTKLGIILISNIRYTKDFIQYTNQKTGLQCYQLGRGMVSRL